MATDMHFDNSYEWKWQAWNCSSSIIEIDKIKWKKINLENRFAKKTIRQETIEAETKTVTTVSRKTKKYRSRKESSICFRGWFVSRCFRRRWSHPLEIRWSETKPRISGDKELVIRFIAAASKLIQTQFFLSHDCFVFFFFSKRIFFWWNFFGSKEFF